MGQALPFSLLLLWLDLHPSPAQPEALFCLTLLEGEEGRVHHLPCLPQSSGISQSSQPMFWLEVYTDATKLQRHKLSENKDPGPL
jgi:hypothetical protein